MFFKYFNTTNIDNEFYVCNIGIMMSLFCISGYDSAGQMGEETADPAINSPKGIVNSVKSSAVTTFIFIVVVLYNLGGTDDEYLTMLANSDNMFYPMFKKQFDSPGLVLFLCMNVLLMLALNGISSISGLSRIVHCMCTDNLLPYSDFFSKIEKRTQVPMRILIGIFFS